MPSWQDIPIASDDALVEAEQNGLDVRVADDMTLQLDLDTREAVAVFEALLDKLNAHFPFTKIDYTTSRSGNTHAYVTLAQPMSAAERIALQACLGSDPTREMLSLRRLLNGDTRPILLFEVRAAQLCGATTSQPQLSEGAN